MCVCVCTVPYCCTCMAKEAEYSCTGRAYTVVLQAGSTVCAQVCVCSFPPVFLIIVAHLFC